MYGIFKCYSINSGGEEMTYKIWRKSIQNMICPLFSKRRNFDVLDFYNLIHLNGSIFIVLLVFVSEFFSADISESSPVNAKSGA